MKFDVNEFFEQLKGLTNTPNSQISKAINTSNNNLSILTETVNQLNENPGMTSWDGKLLVVVSLIFLYSLILTIKYNGLKKNFKDLTNISEKLILQNKKSIEFLQIQKKNLIKNKELSNNLNIKLNKLSFDLKHIINDQNNEKILQIIRKNEKKLIDNILHLTKKNLTEKANMLTKNIKTYSQSKIEESFKKILKNRNFNSHKYNHSYMIYSGISLIAFYGLLEIGMQDIYQETFLLNIDKEYYPSSSYFCGITINDFSEPQLGLNFQNLPSSNSLDNRIEGLFKATEKQLNLSQLED